jgi:phage/plasmid-like protein (TIGR03299 family)
MSHAIEFINGVPCIAYAGETPWHSLGEQATEAEQRDPRAFQKKAGLDWKVEKQATYTRVRGNWIKLDKKALVRDVDSKVLTVTSADWEPVQNDEAFDFFYDLVNAGRMTIETAGSLMDGRKVWVLARITEAFNLRVNGRETEDRIDGFCLLTNPHEYGKSIDGRFTGVRVVCNNTHQLAMNSPSKGIVRLDHRRKFDAGKMRDMMGLAHTGMEEYQQQAEFLASKRYAEETIKEYLSKVFPHGDSERASKGDLSKSGLAALGILDTQPGADVAPGTWWNAYNAVTFVTDHYMGRSADNRLTSAWYGHNRKKKEDAMSSALEFATAA